MPRRSYTGRVTAGHETADEDARGQRAVDEGSWEQRAVDRAARACSAAAARLHEAGVAPEALAEYLPPRRGLLRTKPARMRPVGDVWRLGTLLLDTDGKLYAAGRATRAAERGRPGYQSVSREERREIAAAALRGGYAAGTPVNFDAVPIPLTIEALSADAEDAERPVGLAAGEVRTRWRPGAPLDGAPPLEAFLIERVGLLVDPPLGAS